MTIALGLLAAFIAAIGWGSTFVPMKKLKECDPFFFQFLMALAIFLSSLVVSFAYDSFVFSYLGIIAGLLWATGNALQAFAVKYSGLARANPVIIGILMLASFSWGLFFFREALNRTILGVVGIALLVFGVWAILSVRGRGESFNFKGTVIAVMAGLMFSAYLVPFKLSGIQPMPFLFSMSLGILIGGMIIFLVKKPKISKASVLPGFVTGLIWNAANFSGFFAVLYLGFAVGLPLTQTSLFISVLWGLLYFHEIISRRNTIKIILGTIILFLGAVLLTLAL